jgi:hypothetical protein
MRVLVHWANENEINFLISDLKKGMCHKLIVDIYFYYQVYFNNALLFLCAVLTVGGFQAAAKNHFNKVLKVCHDYVNHPNRGRIDDKASEKVVSCPMHLVINYSHSRNPPCAPARTHGQIQAPREPPN